MHSGADFASATGSSLSAMLPSFSAVKGPDAFASGSAISSGPSRSSSSYTMSGNFALYSFSLSEMSLQNETEAIASKSRDSTYACPRCRKTCLPRTRSTTSSNGTL